ncbi:hypothetical protein BH24DEI2_BH24DEI2_03460 [soil metagenome]
MAEEPQDHLIVTRDALELGDYLAFVSAPEFGAVASFLGTVRSPNAGETVSYIDYEGYEAMLHAQLRVLARELRDRFDVGRLVVAHRLGRLAPGEASIAVVVSSKHRKDALGACHYGIDRAKELLPVWKREVTDAGATWVAGSVAASEPL